MQRQLQQHLWRVQHKPTQQSSKAGQGTARHNTTEELTRSELFQSCQREITDFDYDAVMAI
jgi:hypothetical protein